MTKGCGLLMTMALALWSAGAAGAPPPGTDLDSLLHHWFESQYSVEGHWCCDVSDGHILSDSEWRLSVEGHYEVRIAHEWVRIPARALRDPNRGGGPNPTGQAIVWYNAEGERLTIYCFAPGTLY